MVLSVGFSWIGAITGNPVSLTPHRTPTLCDLRELRQPFDPAPYVNFENFAPHRVGVAPHRPSRSGRLALDRTLPPPLHARPDSHRLAILGDRAAGQDH